MMSPSGASTRAMLNFFGLPPDTDCSAPANALLGGCRALAAQQAILTFAGASCRHLNTYSYGLVEVDATAGTTTITLKDDQGQTIHDQLSPALACTRVIGP
jgi:hypothetical protein